MNNLTMPTTQAHDSPIAAIKHYRVLLVLFDATYLNDWIALASRLCPVSTASEIFLRGIVTVPEGKSLSEGTTQARELRDKLEKVARDLGNVHDESTVYVDYQPIARVIDELQTAPADLLLVQWAGPHALTGGASTDEILQHSPCDVALISGDGWREIGPVLLSLRGGPYFTLGTRVAEALAGESTVTLFHVADSPRDIPDLNRVMRGNPHIGRTVTVVSQIADGIVRESAGHKAIVLGATFRQSASKDVPRPTVMQSVHERTRLPLALVRAQTPEDLAFPIPPLPVKSSDNLSTRVDRWFAENTFHSSEFTDLQKLLMWKEKQGVTISIGLPALNEEKTVGNVIRTIKRALMDDIPLVDEIVLIDSVSTDSTVAIAQSFGIPTFKHPEILPEMGSYRGKGEALWKSLAVLKGDIIAWIDTDISNIHPRFIYGLLGPLLKHPHIQYVKGFYQRPIQVGNTLQAYGGGRVTELVARPLLNLFYPELSGIIQPLSGEYAGRRAALESLPFFSGYGVETGLLIDFHERYGLEGIAQTDLEERVHHNQALVGLSKMSFAIHQVFIARLERRYGVHLLDKANKSMKLIEHGPDRFALDIVAISDVERPPMISLTQYRK